MEKAMGILQKVHSPCIRCNNEVDGFLTPDGRFVCPNCDTPAVNEHWSKKWEPFDKTSVKSDRRGTGLMRKALHALFAVFLILLVISALLSWQFTRNTRYNLKFTRKQLAALSVVLEAYHKKNGEWPTSLDSSLLRDEADEFRIGFDDEKGVFFDIFGKPIRLAVAGKKVLLIGPCNEDPECDVVWEIRDEKGNAVLTHPEQSFLVGDIVIATVLVGIVALMFKFIYRHRQGRKP
jgi:hypothetical protein